MRNGDVVTAGIYRDKIRSVFPESPYAQAMADPHYLDNLRRMSTVQDSIYEATYAAYLENDNRTVHGNTTFMKENIRSRRLCPNSFSSMHWPTSVTNSTTISKQA